MCRGRQYGVGSVPICCSVCLASVQDVYKRQIVEYAKGKNIAQLPVSEFKANFGRGVSAFVEGELWYAGNEKMMREQKVTLSENTVSTLERLSEEMCIRDRMYVARLRC